MAEKTERPVTDPPAVRGVGLVREFSVGSSKVRAVADLDIEVPPGVFALLKGRSGSGKTTLLNLIGGLDKPTRGEVFVEGRPLSELSDEEMTQLRRSRIGFVFQSFALLPTFSAYENVELPLRIAQQDPELRRGRVQRAQLLGLRLQGVEAAAAHLLARVGEELGGS